MTSRMPWIAALAMAGTLAAAPLPSRTVRMTLSTPEDYQRGTLENVIVSSTGELTVGPSFTRTDAGELTLWSSVVEARSGTIYFGSGTEGKIFSLNAKKEFKEVAKTGELVVTALTAGANGKIYAATIPAGKIFALDPADGKLSPVATLPDVYVWSLISVGDALIAGTGSDGKVYRIDAAGQAKVWFETKQSHVLSLAADGPTVYAGTSPSGVLYRISAENKGEVVFNTDEQEIRALTWAGDTLWIGANKSKKFDPNKFVKRLKAAAAQAAQGEEKESPFQDLFDGSVYKMTRSAPARLVQSFPKSYLASIAVDKAGAVYAGTGDEGQVWRINPDGSRSLFAKLKENQAMTLPLVNGELAAIGTGNPGSVSAIGAGPSGSASFTTEIIDAKFPAVWGALTWDATGSLSVQTRSGRTGKPDENTWSAWSDPIKENPAKIPSPVGRYFQVKVTWAGDPKASLRWLTLYYKTENQQPDLKEVEVDTFDDNVAFQGKARESAEVTIRWKAVDADGDDLVSRVYFQREGREEWIPFLQEPTAKKEFKWDTKQAADGVYRVKVAVSDELINPGETALTSVKTSKPIVVDNHKPEIANAKVDGKSVSFTAADDITVIARAEVSIDAGPWKFLLPADGIYDQRTEKFTVAVGKDLGAGVHSVIVRVVDAGGNVAVWQESFKGQ